jgi:hypothetical protein
MKMVIVVLCIAISFVVVVPCAYNEMKKEKNV